MAKRIAYGARRVDARFFEPRVSSSHLDADVAACHAMPRPMYEIEQRIGTGDWQPKCRYGFDDAWAVSRARWWNALLRGRRSYRVVAVLGDRRTVVYGEGASYA